jgi:hypothetical protein
MPKTFKEWTVLPHGKLTRLDDDLLTVVGDLHMPIGEFPRRMTVVRLNDGRLIIFSAIALDEDEMAELEAYGTPAFLIVPNERHRMDARIWKDRYPALHVVAPAGARDRVAETVPVDATQAEFQDPRVRLITVPGTDERELALEVRTSGGTTLVLNELIWNIDGLPGFGGWLAGAMGMTGDEPRIPAVVKAVSVKDERALGRQLQSWSEIDRLERIVVSHGDVITDDPSGTLARLSTSLARG